MNIVEILHVWWVKRASVPKWGFGPVCGIGILDTPPNSPQFIDVMYFFFFGKTTLVAGKSLVTFFFGQSTQSELSSNCFASWCLLVVSIEIILEPGALLTPR